MRRDSRNETCVAVTSNNVALMAERYASGCDIWTGEPSEDVQNELRNIFGKSCLTTADIDDKMETDETVAA